MKVLHRILIGLTGAIGKMGPHSQILTNKIGFEMGVQVGQQLVEDGLIGSETPLTAIWERLNAELQIDPQAEITAGEGNVAEITLRDCHICPKKVGKYAIPGTACPVGGLFHGVAHAADVLESAVELRLSPGETCSIVIRR